MRFCWDGACWTPWRRLIIDRSNTHNCQHGRQCQNYGRAGKSKGEWSRVPSTGALLIIVQPCCVCTEQKAKRDECMLFSTSSDAQKECASLVDEYRQCMAGYGFKI